jgi:hypothetical protein
MSSQRALPYVALAMTRHLRVLALLRPSDLIPAIPVRTPLA